uniref:Neurotransmitter-gated ion-channel ligand-binding domain-containing protein n=1 Tax=Oncorhynchus tshawytscha TaxID=74940 RepID=A0A8C8MJ06_ONCTS
MKEVQNMIDTPSNRAFKFGDGRIVHSTKRVKIPAKIGQSMVSSERVCSYQDVLDHLNLTRGNDVFTSTRPVLDHTHPTMVHLDVYLYAILAVIEKSQTFVPFIWIQLTWNNERIWWDPSQFCGISRVSVPKEMLWIPDLLIYEMIEKDDGPHSPYLYVSHDGIVLIEDEMKVVSTCKMDVHKFPFDTQRCNITFSSAIHIATYCIVIFAFMLLSLLETILVTHLVERDSIHQETGIDRAPAYDCDNKPDHTPCHTCDSEEERRRGCCACICDVSGRKAPCEPLPVAEEVICSEQGESRLLLLILGDLRAVERTLALFASGRREGKLGYWTRVARRLNAAFFTIYLISVMLFISLMCKEWLN